MAWARRVSACVQIVLVDRCRVRVAAHIPASASGHSGAETCAKLWREERMQCGYDIPAHRPEHFSVETYPDNSSGIRTHRFRAYVTPVKSLCSGIWPGGDSLATHFEKTSNCTR